MNFDTVTKTRKLSDDSIELSISDPFSDQPETKLRFATIRGGISWPTPYAPAYFCIVGQVYKDPEEHKDAGERLLMAEYQSDSFTLNKFYNKLIDTATQLHCISFYAIIPANRCDCGFTHDFDRYRSKRDSDVNLMDAYDPDNFMLGMSRIRESLENESLSLTDDSIIKLQLLGITREDIKEAKPEERFHAVNGLRHVLASYYRYPALNRGLITKLRYSPTNWRVA